MFDKSTSHRRGGRGGIVTFQEVPAKDSSESDQRHCRERDPSSAMLISGSEGDEQDKRGRDTDRNQIDLVLGGVVGPCG